ncbi:hypothetical protein JOM56_001634 [Amanita muscaria]
MLLTPQLLVRAANAALSAQPPQCTDINHCRTLPSIIYSCLSTAFLCTWIALHLNVPKNPKISPTFRRLRFMLGALVAPEIVFGFAYCHWIESSAMLKDILGHFPKCRWTETHVQFVRMGGFRLVYADGGTEHIGCRDLFDLVRDGTVDLPNISEEEILERSKRDHIATGITIAQTTWFVVQCIYRRSRGLPTTALEFITLGYAVVNFFIYWCWWYKPQRVGIPIDIPTKKLRLDVKLASWKGSSEEDVVARFFKSHDSDHGDEIKEALADVLTFMSRKGDVKRAHSVTELGELSSPLPSTSNTECGKSSEGHTLVASSSGHHKIDSDPIPMDVEAIQIMPPLALTLRVRLGVMLNCANHAKKLSSHGRTLFLIAFFIVGGSFGLTHCLGWNLEFPTPIERYLWDAMSMVITVIGGAMMVLAGSADENDFWGNTKKAGPYIILITILFYSSARILLLVLALLQLRALPHAAYVSPSWSLYYPHIS